ncbi:efflux RND transporter periplasmic adaptor subunit, partial [Candidatus Omnitrophota bacterium]
GKCPICAMDLIPVTSDSDETQTSPRELKLSASAAKLAEIMVAPVERKFVPKEIRMTGKVEYDETRIGYITAWLPGRIDRLFVDYTGITVRKGDHLVEMYSPELLTAQEELIQALKAVDELKNSKLTTTLDTAKRTIEATREKLRLLGLTHDQIQEFEQKGEPEDHVTIYSPMEGIVIHKNAVEGLYVSTGTRIFTIADLSHVWVILDVYESDLEWIRYGQEMEFNTEAYPGETFIGKIAFIDPVLNDKTRTVKVRVNVPNTGFKLKPNMFVRARVFSRVAAGGMVIDESLAGKFICPMHPEIVKDTMDSCDKCGMDLVKAESLGYANPEHHEPPLVIPASAPLITGKRAVVYVADPERDGVYEGREIVLGPRTGDYYHVEEGLEVGELVVYNGNFKIDSAVQILARPSMMSPEGGAAPAVHHHGAMPAQSVSPDKQDQDTSFEIPLAFRKQIDDVLAAYYLIQYALSHDDSGEAVSGAQMLLKALGDVDMSLVSGEAHMAWMKELDILTKSGNAIRTAIDIDTARKAFNPLSQSIITTANVFGTTGTIGIYRFHCPMAFNNQGADWLQGTSDIENPFFGSTMFKCGDLIETISAGQQK